MSTFEAAALLLVAHRQRDTNGSWADSHRIQRWQYNTNVRLRWWNGEKQKWPAFSYFKLHFQLIHQNEAEDEKTRIIFVYSPVIKQAKWLNVEGRNKK